MPNIKVLLETLSAAGEIIKIPTDFLKDPSSNYVIQQTGLRLQAVGNSNNTTGN